MVYCIDTSGLIYLKSDYSYEVFPPIWDDFIIDMVEQKRLITSIEVKEDLDNRSIPLREWLISNCSNIFIQTDERITRRITEIGARFPAYLDIERPSKNYSDPFVISLALEAVNIIPNVKHVSEIMVITYEQGSGNLKGPKMPDVCKQCGLHIGRLIDMFKNERFSVGKS